MLLLQGRLIEYFCLHVRFLSIGLLLYERSRVILPTGTRSIRLVAKQPRRLVSIHLGDPSSTRSFDEIDCCEYPVYTRSIRNGQIAWKYYTPVSQDLFLILNMIILRPPRKSFLHLVEFLRLFMLRYSVLIQYYVKYTAVLYKFLIVFSAILYFQKYLS